jgi:cytosine/adenosine deaminase-related metal-dependent hydrolase
LIHPGLINAHTHGHGGLARGQGDKWTLELLLAAAPWIGGSRSLQDKKLTTQIVAAEMVLKGCTAAYDLYYEFPMPSIEGLDAAAEAYAGIGMRAVIAPMVADKTVYEAIPGLYDSLPAALQARVDKLRLPAWERTLDAMRGVLSNWRWNSKDIRAAVAPTIPHHCSDAFLCGCRDLARDFKLGLHSHVGESKVQAMVGMRTYGKTLVRRMPSGSMTTTCASCATAAGRWRIIRAATCASATACSASIGRGRSASMSGSAPMARIAPTTRTCTRRCATPPCCRRCRRQIRASGPASRTSTPPRRKAPPARWASTTSA